MKNIIDVFIESEIASSQPGYYNLNGIQVLKISKMHNVLEQIRLRVISERKQDYSVALNHLLNEIHAICYRLDTREISEKNYDVTNSVEFLISKAVPHETCIKIKNLFDRRNKNPVSHADPIAWPVNRDEYFDFSNHVGICLEYLL